MRPHIDAYPSGGLFYRAGELILFRAVQSFSSSSFTMLTLFSGFETCFLPCFTHRKSTILMWILKLTVCHVKGTAGLREYMQH